MADGIHTHCHRCGVDLVVPFEQLDADGGIALCPTHRRELEAREARLFAHEARDGYRYPTGGEG